MKAPVKAIIFALTLVVFCSHSAQQNSAMQAFKNEDYAAVVASLSNTSKKSFEDYQLLINSQMHLELDDAEKSAEQMLKEYSNDYRAYLLHASVMGRQASNSLFSALGYAKKAKKSLEQGAALDESNPKAVAGLIGFHIMAPSIAGGDKDEALRLIEKLKQLDPFEGELAYANYLNATNEEEKAFELLTNLSQNPKTALSALFQLGHIAAGKEDYDQALNFYQQAVEHKLIAPAVQSDPNQLNQFENDVQTQLYAMYRIGWIAVKTDANHQKGKAALMAYINGYTSAQQVYNLPSLSWAKIRLAEILINQGEQQTAKELLTTVHDLEDDDFKKHYKKLKKRLKA